MENQILFENLPNWFLVLDTDQTGVVVFTAKKAGYGVMLSVCVTRVKSSSTQWVLLWRDGEGFLPGQQLLHGSQQLGGVGGQPVADIVSAVPSAAGRRRLVRGYVPAKGQRKRLEFLDVATISKGIGVRVTHLILPNHRTLELRRAIRNNISANNSFYHTGFPIIHYSKNCYL